MTDFVFDPNKRGGGRSTRQMQLAPQRFVFAVGGYGMMNHARTLQRRHVPEKDVEIVLVTDLYRRFRGTDEVIVTDHAALDHIRLPDSELDWLREHTSRYNPS